MYKPTNLRNHLVKAFPDLEKNPEKLLIFADEGNVVARPGTSLSFEYRYILNVIILDYASDSDALMVMLLAWLKVHQIELFENKERSENGIRFEIDYNNRESADIDIKLTLTEAIIIKQAEEGVLSVESSTEPLHVDGEDDPDQQWTLRRGEKEVATWKTPKRSPT